MGLTPRLHPDPEVSDQVLVDRMIVEVQSQGFIYPLPCLLKRAEAVLRICEAQGYFFLSSFIYSADRAPAAFFEQRCAAALFIDFLPDAKYTLIFLTTHTEMGYNIGISSRPAYLVAP